MKRLLAAALIVVAACSPRQVSYADQTRVPSDAGVVTEAGIQRIVLDGRRSYAYRNDVQSFTTRGHQVTALVSWNRRYVHIGLDERRRVRWVAGIGIVVNSAPSYVLYTGVLRARTSERLVFADGTVLRPAPGLETSARTGSEALATIDPQRGVVTALRVQNVTQPSGR